MREPFIYIWVFWKPHKVKQLQVEGYGEGVDYMALPARTATGFAAAVVASLGPTALGLGVPRKEQISRIRGLSPSSETNLANSVMRISRERKSTKARWRRANSSVAWRRRRGPARHRRYVHRKTRYDRRGAVTTQRRSSARDSSEKSLIASRVMRRISSPSVSSSR